MSARLLPVRRDGGYAMVVLLIGIAIMGILMSVAMPAWRTMMRREREEELIFRGQQYARAIGLFQRKFAGAYPPSIDFLIQQRFLRKKYKDPMTKDGEFQLLYQGQQMAARGTRTPGSPTSPGTPGDPGQDPGGATSTGTFQTGGTQVGPRGGIMGVASKSKDTSLKIYNGRTVYSEWQFVYVPTNVGTGPNQLGGPGGTQRGVNPGDRRPGGGPGGPGGGPGGFPRGPGGFGGAGGMGPGPVGGRPGGPGGPPRGRPPGSGPGGSGLQ